MQHQIDHLEGLVKRLIAQRQDVPPNDVVCVQNSPKPGTGSIMTPPALNVSDVACDTGPTMVINDIQSVYKGADDWVDVLQEVGCAPFPFPFNFFSLQNFN